jgi:hypothetical protein
VVLLTAGRDTCDEDYVEDIEERLVELGEDVNLKFHFFTLNVPDELEQQLRALQRHLPDQVEVKFAETPADLEEDMDDLEDSLPPAGPDGPVPGPST